MQFSIGDDNFVLRSHCPHSGTLLGITATQWDEPTGEAAMFKCYLMMHWLTWVKEGLLCLTATLLTCATEKVLWDTPTCRGLNQMAPLQRFLILHVMRASEAPECSSSILIIFPTVELEG